MPSVSASPFLQELLTRWTDHSSSVRSEVSVLLDHLANDRRVLDVRWSARQQERSTVVQRQESEVDKISDRWTERLKRVDEWKGQIQRAEEECLRAESTVRAVGFFDRAQSLSTLLGQRLLSRASQLAERQREIHNELEDWLILLEEKETNLQAFKQKERSTPRPFLVSRARKQPEQDFVIQQNSAEHSFSLKIQALRQDVNHSLGRIYKAGHQLEVHAQTNETLFAGYQRQAQHELKEPQNQLFALRDEVLSDALLYEACRKKLRWIQDAVRSIRCLEDIYKAPEPFWKKFLRLSTSSTRSR